MSWGACELLLLDNYDGACSVVVTVVVTVTMMASASVNVYIVTVVVVVIVPVVVSMMCVSSIMMMIVIIISQHCTVPPLLYSKSDMKVWQSVTEGMYTIGPCRRFAFVGVNSFIVDRLANKSAQVLCKGAAFDR